MEPSSQPQADRLLGRLQRVLSACRKGLNHDLANQLVALQGLLQLLDAEESARLSAAGQEYVQRLRAVTQRTHSLTRTLADLSRLASDAAPPEVVVLPQLVEDAKAAVQPTPTCDCEWQAARVLAPRTLLVQALTIALRLLAETPGGSASSFKFLSRPAEGVIELIIRASPSLGVLPPLALAGSSPLTAVQLPRHWHERLECVLLRELADMCGGTVEWRVDDMGAAVRLTLPAPPVSTIA